MVHHIKKNNAGLLCVLIFILFCGLLLLTVATTKTLHSCGGSIVCFQVCNFSVYKIPIWMSLLIVASGIIFASIRVLVDLFKTQRFLKQLSILGSLPVCFSASFPTNRILVFQNDVVCWAFSAGVFRPKIYLSTGLIQLMTVKEIQAILKHEEYHCRQFDPLRNLIINFLSDSMFFFPVFRRLQRSFQVSSEKAADQFAICCGSSPLELSEALIKLFRARNQVQKFIFVSSIVVGSRPISRLICTAFSTNAPLPEAISPQTFCNQFRRHESTPSDSELRHLFFLLHKH